MANIIVDPIPYNPGAVANGTAYTPDLQNNYITIPNLEVTADLNIPSETFVAKYTPTVAGRTISHAMAVIAQSSYSTTGATGTLSLVFHAQVFFTDSTSDYQQINASILVNEPSDFTAFSIAGPFTPVIPLGGVSAAYDTVVITDIAISIDIEAIILPISGTASVKVRVATGA